MDLTPRASSARVHADTPDPTGAGHDPEGLRNPQREPSRLLDLGLGTIALFAWSPPGVPIFVTAGFVAVSAILALAVTRRPPRPVSGPGGAFQWLGPLLIGLLLFLAAVSISTPDDSLTGWPKRALRLVLVIGYLLAVVSGRVHYPSLVRGMALGLIANAVLFYAGIAPALYGEFLSGYLLDKNQAGLAYVVVGLLYLGLVEGRQRQGLVVVVSLALVWLTGSRTSIAAFVCGLAWFAAAGRLRVGGRLALAVALAGAVQFVEGKYARVGVFADRDGSDEFRQRIDTASRIKLDATGPSGRGLGEAWVDLEGRIYLFHNSYWSALVEGGWVLCGAYVGLTALVGIGLLRTGSRTRTWAAAEGANVAILVCALRLGEVFGTTAAMTALGAGFIGLMAHRREVGETATGRDDPGPPLPTRGPARPARPDSLSR